MDKNITSQKWRETDKQTDSKNNKEPRETNSLQLSFFVCMENEEILIF